MYPRCMHQLNECKFLYPQKNANLFTLKDLQGCCYKRSGPGVRIIKWTQSSPKVDSICEVQSTVIQVQLSR